MLFSKDEQLTDYERVRKEFYRLWFFSYKVSQQAKLAQKQGKEEEARGAMTAFRALSKQAKEAYSLMDSLREARPDIIDVDVAVDEDLRYIAPEFFLPESAGGLVVVGSGD